MVVKLRCPLFISIVARDFWPSRISSTWGSAFEAKTVSNVISYSRIYPEKPRISGFLDTDLSPPSVGKSLMPNYWCLRHC
jgi:hypothetical protein